MKKLYTKEHVEWVRNNYPMYPLKQLTIIFNQHFNMNVTEYGLHYLCQNYHITSGRTGKFEKGYIPPNKGRPITEWMSPEKIQNSTKTRFKKGDPSFNNSNHNELPVGTEVTTKDGYVILKLDKPYHNPIGKAHPNWVLKQIYVYEQANGPIPKGHKVIFLDGNRQNCELSNLQLVSNDVHLRMNRHRYYGHSKEITQAGIEIFQTEKLIKEKLNNA